MEHLCKLAKEGKPFFLNYWQFSVHAPFDAKRALVEKHRARVDPNNPQRSPTYAAMVESLDDAVGTLLDALDRLDLAERTEVPEIENFVATIVQADQLGVSIAKVLRAQAEQMRIIRRQRAEEQARQATIKLLFPLVFLIFPALLAVLLGPAVPQVINTFSSL